MDKVRAPYGFVPLNPRVAHPEWGESVSLDAPYADGICGTLQLEVQARSPIFIRGTGDQTRPFHLPDGTWALPGSSLRGMLRNVVEIASLGKLNRVNAHRYALRDLHNQKSYVSQMAKIQDRQPIPLVNAGWLVPTGDPKKPVRLHPCHFAKLEYAKLREIAAAVWGVDDFDPGRKQSAVEKYCRALRLPLDEKARPEGWYQQRLSSVKLSIDRIARPVSGLRSEYGKVTGPGAQRCHVVMTGQPSPYDPRKPKGKGSGNPKHHDFVFHGTAGAPIELTPEQFEDFEFAHADRGQQNRLDRSHVPNAEWSWWRQSAYEQPPDWFEGHPERGVPVFFLLSSDGRFRAMGLAMMFRLGSRSSVWDAVQRAQPDCLSTAPDLAETLFGTVPDRRRDAKEESEALAGRVSIGVARATTPTQPGKPVQVVLSNPKASYYPNYVEQRTEPGQPPGRDGKNKPDWQTWMEERPDPVPRGWKRYRPIEGHQTLTPPRPTDGKGRPLDLSKVATTFCPLPAGTRFTAPVRLHNVRPIELGALLWALDFGGAADTFHKLGLGRPLGYGTVTLRPSDPRLTRNDGEPVDAATCVAAFRTWMQQRWTDLGGEGAWEDSRTIRELIALARPQPRDDARHMQIDHPKAGNEFQQAKLGGLVLAPASTGGGWFPPAARKVASGGPPGPAASVPGAPSLPRAGDTVQVRLTGQNKKGRWQGELIDGRGSGTFVSGEPPAGIDAGQQVRAKVVRASSRLAIELAWGS